MSPLHTNAPSDRRAPASADSHADLARFFAEADASDPALCDDAEHIGARLAHARTKAGLSQRDVAARIGVKEATVVKWEAGETSPRGHRLNRLAGMFGVSISWILMGHGVEPATRSNDVDQVRRDLEAVRARLDDAVNELAVLDQRLASLT